MDYFPSPELYNTWQEWAGALEKVLKENTPIQLYVFPKGNLPPATEDGLFAFCTDETGGAVPVFVEGGQWRRVTDRAVVS